jgi:ABC-type amino acid transport substrate-binding protein
LKKLKVIAFILVVTLSVLIFAGCGNKAADAGGTERTASDTSLQTVIDSGVLRVGMCPEYPPFESIDSTNQIVGFDPSLAEEIANELGIEVECVNTPWEGLIAGLNNGDFDIIMSAMSPEEATAATEAVQLSENYYTLRDTIVVRSDNTDIQSQKDLEGKIVGVQDACSAAAAAEGLAENGINVAKLNHYTRNSEAFADLANSRIDAIIVSDTYANEQAKSNPTFKVINDPLQEIGIAVVAKQGSVSLIEKINEIMTTLKDNGTYDKVVTEWLASDK